MSKSSLYSPDLRRASLRTMTAMTTSVRADHRCYGFLSVFLSLARWPGCSTLGFQAQNQTTLRYRL